MSDNVIHPNIINRPDAASVISSGITLIVLSVVAVAIRFWARRHQNAFYRADDWLTLPALAVNLVLGGMTIWSWKSRSLGYKTPVAPPGVDPLDLMDPRIQIGKKVTFALELLQAISLACTKASLLFFYRRIFYTGLKNTFHWITLGLIVFIILWGITFFFAFMFICGTHTTALWTDIRTINTECKAFLPVEVAFGVTDVAVDLAVFALPFVMVLKLRMSRPKKFATAAIFLLGAFAIAASVMRLVVLINAVITVKKAYQKSKTGANNGTVAAATVWGNIESCATLCTACLLVVYAPIRDLMKRYIWGSARASSYDETISAKSQRMWQLSQAASYGIEGFDDSTTDNVPMVAQVTSTAHKDAPTTTHNQDNESDRESVNQGRINVIRTLEQVSHNL